MSTPGVGGPDRPGRAWARRLLTGRSAVDPDPADRPDTTEPDSDHDDFGVRLRWPDHSEDPVVEGVSQDHEGGPPAPGSADADGEDAVGAPEGDPAGVGLEETHESPEPAAADPAAAGGPGERRPLATAPEPVRAGVASRVESVHGAVAAMSMRIDSLVAATTSLRSILSDRLAEYAEAVSAMARTAGDEAAEDRASMERFSAEVRRALIETEAALRRIASSVDSVDNGGALLGEQLGALVDEVKALGSQTDRLTQELLDSVAEAHDRVVAEMAAAGDVSTGALGKIHAEIAALRTQVAEVAERESQPPQLASVATLGSQVASLREEVAAVLADRRTAALEAVVDDVRHSVNGVYDELAGVEERLSLGATTRLDHLAAALETAIADAMNGAAAAPVDADATAESVAEALAPLVEDIQSDLAVVRQELRRVREATAGGAGGEGSESVRDELQALRAELASLRRRLPVRARAGETPALTLSDKQLDAIVTAVVDRLSAQFEVVEE